MAYDELSKAISVTDASKLIKDVLEESFYQIVVRGEITNYRPATSGHAYFNLADDNATLPSVIFRSALYGMPTFKNGDMVVATGRISYYEKGGKLSFIISRLQKEGDGMLQAMIEKRKLYYQNLGWFDPQLKKPLPENISTIGVVTSATGAVFHDILNVTRRRAPGVDILLFPCAVQGKGAETTIASRIRQANNFDACDVLIVGRGGGSLEDLSPFSEEEVIIAIHESHIPVISAVGHETDWSLSDYVADLRAGTPSIAAERATDAIFQKRSSLNDSTERIGMLMRRKVMEAEKRLPDLERLSNAIQLKVRDARNIISSLPELKLTLERKKDNALFRLSMAEEGTDDSLRRKLQDRRRDLESLRKDLASELPKKVQEAKALLKALKREDSLLFTSKVGIKREEVKRVRKEVEALSPLSILSRGYAVVTDKDGRALRNAKDTKDGDKVSIRLYKGSVDATIGKEKENEF